MVYFKALLVWCVIAAAEVMHGILRARYLAPAVGDFRSRQIGVLTGSVLLLTVTYALLPWTGISSAGEALPWANRAAIPVP